MFEPECGCATIVGPEAVSNPHSFSLHSSHHKPLTSGRVSDMLVGITRALEINTGNASH